MRSVLLIASEGLPFSKTGGLADVMGALPPALAGNGWHATVVLPKYRGVSEAPLLSRHVIKLGGRAFDIGFNEQPLASGARAILVDCPELFDRIGAYGGSGGDYPDNALRFGVLSVAALEFAARFGPRPDVVHAHDWQAALAPVYLRASPRFESTLGSVATVFTIHNLAYQGIFEADWLSPLDIPVEQFNIDGMEFWGRINFLKGGILNADLITTVSGTYAREIQTPEYGFGIDGVLRQRATDLVGILNGIDTEVWNPAKDRFLPKTFDAKDLTGKRFAKKALLQYYHLPDDDRTLARPLFGIVSRMASQKGFDILEEAASEMLGMDVTLVLLGTGEHRYEHFWRTVADTHPDRVGAHIGFDDRLAHLIEAGSDAFLMPSRYEPCGLNQMFSLRYGTVPVVRAIGGLADSVDPEVGFLFREYSAVAFLATLREATRVFRDEPQHWEEMIKRGMGRDHSWAHVAAEYSGVYERAIAKHQSARRR